jgi:hypothetical protein
MPTARSRHPAILAALLPLVILVVEAVAFAAARTDRSGHRVYLFLTNESEVVRLTTEFLSESIAR